jgi:AraC-like DNA-binding protein
LKIMIESDPLRLWRVSELARHVGLSSGHLHSLCRAVLGKSLKRLIVEARLRRGIHLLKQRSDGTVPSVKEVSRACGFSTQHFFSRQFKKYFHLSPTAYRDGSELG